MGCSNSKNLVQKSSNNPSHSELDNKTNELKEKIPQKLKIIDEGQKAEKIKRRNEKIELKMTDVHVDLDKPATGSQGTSSGQETSAQASKETSYCETSKESFSCEVSKEASSCCQVPTLSESLLKKHKSDISSTSSCTDTAETSSSYSESALSEFEIDHQNFLKKEMLLTSSTSVINGGNPSTHRPLTGGSCCGGASSHLSSSNASSLSAGGQSLPVRKPTLTCTPSPKLVITSAGLDVSGKPCAALLVDGAYRGDAAFVAKMLDAGVPVDAVNEAGHTALHISSLWGYADTVTLLLKRGASPNTQGDNGWTVIIKAAQDDQKAIVRLLIDHGADLNIQGNDGTTALMAAIAKGRTEVANMLIQGKANVNVQNKKGSSALHIAALYGQDEVINTLLDVGANIEICDKQDYTPLIAAADSGQMEVVQALANRGANINAQSFMFGSFTALHRAATRGHISVVEYLLSAGADRDIKDMYDFKPINWADKYPDIMHVLQTYPRK